MRVQKFIIVGGKFRCGYVVMHSDLLNPGEVCQGGGMFYIDQEKKEVVLYGKSIDFGAPHDIESLDKTQVIEEIKNYYYDQVEEELEKPEEYKLVYKENG